jgi:hypothetical protein
MPFGFGEKTEDDLEELESEEQRLQVRARNKQLELTIAEKNAALKKLRDAGLSPSSFGGSWDRIRSWIRGH